MRLKLIGLIPVLVLVFVLSTQSAKAAEFRVPQENSNNVEINTPNPVDDNVFAAGQNVIINTPVAGDLFVTGSRIEINQDVTGNVFAAGNEIIINGKISHDAFLAGDSLLLGTNATIEKNLYAGVNHFSGKNVDQTVKGKQFIKNPPKLKPIQTEGLSTLSLLLTGIILVQFLPRTRQRIIEIAKTNWGKSVLLGIAGLILIPILIGLLIATAIAIPLGLILLTFLMIDIYLSTLAVGLVLGNAISANKLPPILSLILGVVVLQALRFIHQIAPLVNLAILVFGLGLIWQTKLTIFKSAQKEL